MIWIYDIGNTNYDKNGNAALIPTDAKIKMVAGGNYELTMNHPIDPDGKWQHLEPGAVLKVPVPREEIENDYERNTGAVIAERFAELDYESIPAVLVSSHGVFTWGKNAEKAVAQRIHEKRPECSAVIRAEHPFV